MIFFSMVLALVGCSNSPTTVKDSESPTMDEIVLSAKGQRYLTYRRDELTNLTKRTSALDAQLLARLGSLHRIDKKLIAPPEKTGISKHERATIHKKIAKEKGKMSGLYKKISHLKDELTQFKKQERESVDNQEDDKAEINALKVSISELEDDVVIMNQVIKKTLALMTAK